MKYLDHRTREALRRRDPRRMRWFFVAAAAPVVMLVASGLLLSLSVHREWLSLMGVAGGFSLTASLLTMPMVLIARRLIRDDLLAVEADASWCRRCGYVSDEAQTCPECGLPRGCNWARHPRDALLLAVVLCFCVVLATGLTLLML